MQFIEKLTILALFGMYSDNASFQNKPLINLPKPMKILSLGCKNGLYDILMTEHSRKP
jgi:hypothetical protein